MYSSAEIANYLLLKGRKEDKPITPMKLQKLLYFAHGWYLATMNEPLLREPFEVWKYGPVIARVYEEFRHFRNERITELMSEIHREKDDWVMEKPVVNDKETREILDAVWKIYADFTPLELSALTHKPGSPWEQVVKKYGGIGKVPYNRDLDEQTVKEYFTNLLESVGKKRQQEIDFSA
jgi:uncharacterized phage-associated protein